MSEPTSQQTVFAEAEAIINGPRRSSYGDVQESFGRVANVWSAVLRVPVTAEQVAMCMVGLKLCREANKHNRDNIVDVMGYAGLLQQLHEGGGK